MNFIYFCVIFVHLYSVSGNSVSQNPFIITQFKLIDELAEEPLVKKSTDLGDIQNPVDVNKRNVVLFLAHSDNVGAEQDSEVLQMFNIEQKTRIKRDNYMVKSSRFSPKRTRNLKTCDELLKLSLLSLVNYCRVGLGMTTALASVCNDTLYNEIKWKTDQDTEEHKDADNDLLGIPHNQGICENCDNSGQPTKRPANYKSVPSYALYGVNRFGKPFADLVTDKEQKDSFRIRSKRQYDDQPPSDDGLNKDDIPPIPCAGNDNKSFWGIMDVMSDTKFSFFGRIFGKDFKSSSDDMQNNNSNNNDINNDISNNNINPLDKLGEVKDTSLFDVVKDTLTSLQNKDSSYLMIVIGGDIGDLSNKDSPLTQSVKHVVENDVSNQTLFVITGMCPDQSTPDGLGLRDDGPIRMGEGVSQTTDQNISIPVYARGPGSCLLSQCSELYDVPILIKTILKKRSSDDGSRRRKRSIINVRQTQEVSTSRNLKVSWELLLHCLTVSIAYLL